MEPYAHVCSPLCACVDLIAAVSGGGAGWESGEEGEGSVTGQMTPDTRRSTHPNVQWIIFHTSSEPSLSSASVALSVLSLVAVVTRLSSFSHMTK